MADELLVRCYNVGLGDCIYLRVPDGDAIRHVLIDCGNKYSDAKALFDAVRHLEGELPEAPNGRRQLDLLVVTHPHEDHVRGIDTETFANVAIRNLWLSDGMDPEHPQKETLDDLHGFAEETLARLRDGPSLGLRELAESLLALNKADAMDAIYHGLPERNHIEPRYVHADTPADEIRLFDDPKIKLHVLAPMHDIDKYYLGRAGEELHAFQSLCAPGEAAESAAPEAAAAPRNFPTNVSRGDFERLRSRMLDHAFGFVLKQGHLINNLSVVLLLEWHGRRLLFTGDAEVELARRGQFEEGKRNGSWNTMWAKRRELLDAPIDFLKVGHHGSENATPWTPKTVREGGDDEPHPVNAILDALLPPQPGASPRGHAIVSTRRTTGYETIPDPALLIELGRRVANAERYQEQSVKGHFVPHDAEQPWRTDLRGGSFVELRFRPLP
jgi:Metallo-beta-lactamase superfamily